MAKKCVPEKNEMKRINQNFKQTDLAASRQGVREGGGACCALSVRGLSKARRVEEGRPENGE